MAELSEEEKQKIVEEERVRAQARQQFNQPQQTQKQSILHKRISPVGCLGVIILLLFLWFLWAMVGNSLDDSRSKTQNNTTSAQPTETTPADESHVAEARACAELQVEKQLKAPSTADFGGCTFNECVTPLGEDKYKVSAYVDAQNSFGANIRSNYTCEMTVTDPENVLCTGGCTISE